MSLLMYGVIALAVIGSLSGLYYKVNHDGYERGIAAARQECQVEADKAKAIADADRKRQEAARDAQAKDQSRRLADAQKRTQALQSRLEANIAAAGDSVKCSLTPSLFDDWNAANRGPTPESPAPRVLPPAPKPPAPSG